MKELDSNIFACNKKLIKLKIGLNEITKLNNDIFRGLTQLTHLDLSYNKMVQFPEGPFENSLKILNLSGNELVKLKIFKGFDQLTCLDLSNNRLVSLPRGLLGNCTALKVVDLSRNKLKKLETPTFQNLLYSKN